LTKTANRLEPELKVIEDFTVSYLFDKIYLVGLDPNTLVA
jgi:hypothetical protein